jgi:HAE1 family hydrophobic/amphiphilic exporter-1
MIPQFSVRHPITVVMIMLGISILGAISLDRLGTDLLPSIYNPRIVVELRAGERSPQEMEERFARQLEGELRSVSRAVDVRTVCMLGRVQMTVTFAWGADMDFALLDVQKKVARYESRQDVDQVTIARFDPQAEPVMIYALSGADRQDLDELRRVAEDVVKLSLERLDGVARVQVYGGLTREVRVELDEYLLAAYSLNPADVTNAIRQSNANASGGTLEHENTAYAIKGIGRYTGIPDIGATIVGYRSRGGSGGDSLSAGGQQAGRVFEPEKAPIYLTEVGRIFYAPEERSTLVRLNGRDCIGIYVYKEAEDNTVRVTAQVQEALVRMQKDLPALSFTPVYNQGAFIDNAVGEVESAALLGILLAVAVLFAFLRNAGATFIVGLAIPLSILATFTLMYFQGMTLNIMTLGGLALGAGMLVDNAIVVIENIFRRRQLGEEAEEASIQGTAEVGVAIVASTLTTVVVFLPIVYVRGVAAELFKEQAWVVAYALLSSLLVAFLFIPAAAARLFARESTAFRRERLRVGWYERLLVRALDRRGLVIGASLCLLIAAGALAPKIGADFIPRSAENQLQIDLELAPGTPLERTEAVIAGVETRVAQGLGAGVRQQFSTANVTTAQSLWQEEGDRAHQAVITLTFADEGPARLSPEAAIARLRPPLSDLPGVSVAFRVRETSLQQTIGAQAAPVAVEIRGTDAGMLQTLARRVQQVLEQLPEVHTVETSAEEARPELTLRIDRLLAASFGVDLQQIAQRIRERLEGEVATDFFSEGEDRNIRVVFPRARLEDLNNLPVQTSNGAVLRLRDIARLVPGEGPKTIQRHNQSRIVAVTAHLAQGVTLDQATDRILRALDAVPLPAGYQFRVGGAEASRRESFDQLRFALILSILLVYMVMASLFESLRHPFTILLTLPLAGVGVVFAFLLAGEPFSVMALIGVVMLGGIAVNNAIILVDYINRLRAGGLARREAVLRAGRDRLRPILMTSLTTILALLPLTIGLGEGARLRAPMALAVIGGLVTSTLLTLVVIPVVYELLDGREKPGAPS